MSQGERLGEGREAHREMLPDPEASMGDESYVVIYIAT